MNRSDQTYDLSLLDASMAKWKASSALRCVYSDIFSEMRTHCVPGPSLEIGSGIGIARDFFPDLTTSDVVPTRFVDRAVSAYAIPRESWSNIIAMDMLHHLQEPLRFLESAAAALLPGGRIILIEPAATPWGRRFYRWFHHEPCLPAKVKPPFRFPADADGSFANMGMAYALFVRERTVIAPLLRGCGLTLVRARFRDVFAYPATGGFSGRAILPAVALRAVLAVERWMPENLMRILGLRMLVVLEKTIS